MTSHIKQQMIVVLLIGCVIGYCVSRYLKFTKSQSSSLDRLKDALLTYSISKIRRNDFDHFNVNYQSFDGTKLPMLSGFSLANACFTYMHLNMFGKKEAINRYLSKNFATDEQVLAFFEEFTKDDNKTESKDEEDEIPPEILKQAQANDEIKEE
jgi:hypothetical protein